MFTFFFFADSWSWTPVFHQAFASRYCDLHYPNITEEQRESFLLGSMYADGIQKNVTHYVKPAIGNLNRISDKNSSLYWFFLGIYNHLAVDTFAHAGKNQSFVVAKGLKHHLSELAICSWARRNFKVQYLRMSPKLRSEILESGVKFRNMFKYEYPICYILSYLPMHRLIPFLEKSNCQYSGSKTYQKSLTTFKHYLDMMMVGTEEIMSHFDDSLFTEKQIKRITKSYIYNFECPAHEVEDNLSSPYFGSLL